MQKSQEKQLVEQMKTPNMHGTWLSQTVLTNKNATSEAFFPSSLIRTLDAKARQAENQNG